MSILFFLLIIGFGIFGSVFWIWMLVDCATKDPDPGAAKVIWLLFILFTHTFGAILYLLIRRPRRFSIAYRAHLRRDAM